MAETRSGQTFQKTGDRGGPGMGRGKTCTRRKTYKY